jgi:hypothetical protein
MLDYCRRNSVGLYCKRSNGTDCPTAIHVHPVRWVLPFRSVAGTGNAMGKNDDPFIEHLSR